MSVQALTRSGLGWLLAASLMLAASPGPARASGVTIEAGRLTQREGVYYIDARLSVTLSDVARDALEKGVPLIMAIHLEVARERAWWLWDETIAERSRRFRLQFHALSERYLLTDLDTDDSRSFRGRSAMLAAFGDLRELPVIDRRLLAEGARYRVSLRAGLDLDALPRPLHTLAYISPGWRLMSDWRSWELTP